MSNAKVAIVTDSTAYIPKDLIERYGIYVIPNIVVWSGKSYRDGIDLHARDFFERLKVDPVHPTTSVASLGDMKEVYARAAESAEAVVGIHLSTKLSNTYAVAREACSLIPGKEFHIVDSETTSMAMGFITLAAAKAAAEGQTGAQVAQLARAAVSRVGLVLTMETLKYLQRGGRIGPAQAFVGGVLDLKPILQVRDGIVQPVERVRSKKKAIQRLIELVRERVAGKSDIRLAAIHALAEAEAKEMLAAAQAQLGSAVVEAMVTDVAATVAVHTGPGTVGLAFSEGI